MDVVVVVVLLMRRLCDCRTDQQAVGSGSRLTSVLIRRSLHSPKIACAFFWLLQSEKENLVRPHPLSLAPICYPSLSLFL